MNNCYGKNEDMQKVLIFGIAKDLCDKEIKFYISLCVSDTDDVDSQRQEIACWLQIMTNKGCIKSWDFVEGCQVVADGFDELPYDFTDISENEFNVYMEEPNKLWELLNYDHLHNIDIPF